MARTSRSYSLEHGGPPRVVVTWEGSFRDVQVLFDGAVVGSLDRAQVTRGGAKIALPDGSSLDVRVRGLLGIEILRDGEPLPGSDLDPKRVLRNASFLVFVLGAIDTAWDAARVVRGGASLSDRGAAVPLALDVVLVALSVGTFAGVRIALGIAIAAFVLRFGFEPQRQTATLIFGLVATWILATHFFAAAPRRSGKV